MNSRDESLVSLNPHGFHEGRHAFASPLIAADVNVKDLDLHMSHAIARLLCRLFPWRGRDTNRISRSDLRPPIEISTLRPTRGTGLERARHSRALRVVRGTVELGDGDQAVAVSNDLAACDLRGVGNRRV